MSVDIRTWLRANLFSSWGNGVLTVVIVGLGGWLATSLVQWAVFDAVWTGSSGADCRGEGAVACWPFVGANLLQFLFGPYPGDERWRVVTTMALGAAGLAALMTPRVPGKPVTAVVMVVIFPWVAFWLLRGGLGLAVVPTSSWGGLLVTLVVSVSGIAAALPLGILLALGRRSELPVLRAASIAFIELWRGVPLVTVLFMASVMLPLFLPPGASIDLLLRCMIGVALFAAAYMAEVVRGGLQALPEGQYEAADALGLGYWRGMGLVVLPQALRHVLPGIVNTMIGLFKDTTLVLIVGLTDFLGAIQRALNDPHWFAPGTNLTGYAFAGLVYWLFCFGLSRYASALERHLAQGDRP